MVKYLFVDHLKNRNDFLMHYEIQEFVSVDDLLKKIGKANRVFGKGGMVNVAAVRTSLLADWYTGKLNYIF
jgi:ribosome biogenesis GTPase A